MTTKRYTFKQLESDCAQLNQQMSEDGIQWVLVPGQRNGYSAVDIATPEQAAEYSVQDNIRVGTPRECLTEACLFVRYAIMRNGGKA